MPTLEALIEAVQKAGTDDNAPTAEQAKAALAELFSAEKLSREDIDSIQGEALDAYKALTEKDPAEVSDDDLTGIEVLATVIESTRDQQTVFDQAAQERADRLAAINKRVMGEPSADADPEPGEEPTPDDAPKGPEAKDPEPAADPAPQGDPAPAPEPSDPAPASEAPKQEALVASTRPRTNWKIGDAAKRAPKVEVIETPGIEIVAAAGTPDFVAGQKLDGPGDLARAAQNQIDRLPFGMGQSVHRGAFAKVNIPFPDELTTDPHNEKKDMSALEAAVDMSRLDGGLVAAGGWCAPSERFYDLSPLLASASAGLVSLPEIAVPRGGISTTEGADFSAIWAGDVGKVQTEAQAIAGTAKVFFKVPCTAFDETRADVIYTGITASILQNNTYPELTKQYVDGSMVAHARRINLESIKRMVAKSGAVIDLTGTIGPSAAASLLNGVELQIMDARYKFRTPEGFPMEVVAPIWLKMAIRADLALRSGVDFVQVPDSQIDQFFTQRGANVQWVYDWQDAFSGVVGGFGSAAARTTYPETVDLLIYPAGTFVRGRGAVIQLEAVYDSTLLEQNEYLALFTEEKLLIHKRQYSSRLTRMAVTVNGATSAPVALEHGGIVTP